MPIEDFRQILSQSKRAKLDNHDKPGCDNKSGANSSAESSAAQVDYSIRSGSNSTVGTSVKKENSTASLQHKLCDLGDVRSGKPSSNNLPLTAALVEPSPSNLMVSQIVLENSDKGKEKEVIPPLPARPSTEASAQSPITDDDASYSQRFVRAWESDFVALRGSFDMKGYLDVSFCNGRLPATVLSIITDHA